MEVVESEGEGRSVLAERCPRPPVTLFHLEVGGARLLVLHFLQGMQRLSMGRQGERGRVSNLCRVWKMISLAVFKSSFHAALLWRHRSSPLPQPKGQAEGNDTCTCA